MQFIGTKGSETNQPTNCTVHPPPPAPAHLTHLFSGLEKFRFECVVVKPPLAMAALTGGATDGIISNRNRCMLLLLLLVLGEQVDCTLG